MLLACLWGWGYDFDTNLVIDDHPAPIVKEVVKIFEKQARTQLLFDDGKKSHDH